MDCRIAYANRHWSLPVTGTPTGTRCNSVNVRTKYVEVREQSNSVCIPLLRSPRIYAVLDLSAFDRKSTPEI
jgi:hypothetical protein